MEILLDKFDEKIINDLAEELEYARDKWGEGFDKKNTLNDWVAYINMYASDAAKMDHQHNPAESRKLLLKSLGLCLSAIRQYDQNGKWPDRHYDGTGVSNELGANMNKLFP